jgi:hypothetical protein
MFNKYRRYIHYSMLVIITLSFKSESHWYSGLALKGQAALLFSASKTDYTSIGTQFVSSYGASIGYYRSKYYGEFFANYHETIYAIENSFVIYKAYYGFEGGIGNRITLLNSNGFWKTSGIGINLSCSVDRYVMVKQYMFYPSIGVYGFSILRMKKWLPIEFTLPVIFSLRQSGNIISICASFTTGLMAL